MELTSESVLALAPDASSVKAAQALLKPGQWPTLGFNENAVWGECKGSGSKPYQVEADLSGPVFKCTCPSRKFPCKHSLALLLLRVQQEAAFTQGEAPDWVKEWLDAREKRAARQEQKQENKDENDRRAQADASGVQHFGKHRRQQQHGDDITGIFGQAQGEGFGRNQHRTEGNEPCALPVQQRGEQQCQFGGSRRGVLRQNGSLVRAAGRRG